MQVKLDLSSISGFNIKNGQSQAQIVKHPSWSLDGDENLPLEESNHSIEDDDFEETQESMNKCEPECPQPCLNAGWCIAPGECRCTEGFFGEQCEFSKF